MHLSDIFTVSINIAGNGGVNVPCGLGKDTGLPVGVQLICPQFKDVNMFRCGRRFGGCRTDVAHCPGVCLRQVNSA